MSIKHVDTFLIATFHTALQTQSDAYKMAHQPAREPTVELADIFLLDVFH